MLPRRRSYMSYGVRKQTMWILTRSDTNQAVQLRLEILYIGSTGIVLYQSPLILTELFQHNLINVSNLTASNLHQVMMSLHF